MAKDKGSKLIGLTGDRDLGAVTKKLPSGMFVTNKGEKVPPFPGVTIGTKIRLNRSKFEIVDGEKKVEVNVADADKSKISALEAKVAALEKQVGEKGSAAKVVTGEAGANTPAANTPPKVES